MRVMDLICFRCGEPCYLYDVLYDIPWEFSGMGCTIQCCPSCASKEDVQLSDELRHHLGDLAVAAELYGNDYTAFAYFLEDMHFV